MRDKSAKEKIREYLNITNNFTLELKAEICLQYVCVADRWARQRHEDAYLGIRPTIVVPNVESGGLDQMLYRLPLRMDYPYV